MTLTIDKIIIKDKVKCEQKAKLYIKFINHFLKLNEKLTKKEYELHHIIPKSLRWIWF